MSSIILWGWDSVNTEYVKALVDSLGHFQIDVLTLPVLDTHLYAFDGTDWTWLLTESAAQRNLRVRLYVGAETVDADNFSVAGLDVTAKLGLYARTQNMLMYSGTNAAAWYTAFYTPDADEGYHTAAVGLCGYNGATWDRLRSYGTGVLAVAKGAITPSRIRMTATGRVGVAGAKKLFWIACSPDSPAAEWEITDADAGGGTVVYDHFDSDKHSDHLDFNPPMEFATGIWVEKFDHMKSLVFCYK